jgi:hypothetical protein
VANRNGEQIDDLVCVRANDVRPKDLATSFINQRFIAINGFSDTARRVPIWYVGRIYAQLWRLLARG